MHVRPARLDDMAAVYRICHELGMSDYPDPREPELLGHVYAGPYVAGPGTRSVVVVDEVGVAGYLLCALDTVAFEQWRDEFWWPGLRADYPLEQEGRTAADQEIIDLIHAPTLASAEIAERYPAHLHVDLLPRLHGQGIGSRLIVELIDDLRERGIRGLHLDVGKHNTGAIALYRRLGFVEQEETPDSIFMGIEIGGAGAQRP